MPDAFPDTVTVPAVELVRIGAWRAAQGDGTITAEDLDSMVEAAADPEIDAAAVRIGHTDPTFDGQPALGWLANIRRDGDRLLADLTDVPRNLAPRLRDAWRRRSIEALANITTPSGRTYRRALTGLALLGITAPAVKGLADVAALYARTGATPITYTATTEDHPMTLSELRTLLDLPADATDEDVRARVTAMASAGSSGNGNPPAQVPAPPPPAGGDVVLVDRAAFAELQQRAAAGDTARQQMAARERDQIITGAIAEGRITPARRAHFATLFDADPEGTRVLLTAEPEAGGLARNTAAAVVELGHAGGADDQDDPYELYMAARGLTDAKER